MAGAEACEEGGAPVASEREATKGEKDKKNLTSQVVSAKTLLCPTSSFSGGKTKPLHKKV